VLVGLGHVDLVCSDLERSLAFYGSVFGALGLQPPLLVDGERGESIHYLRFPEPGSGSLGLRQAQAAQPFELYRPGAWIATRSDGPEGRRVAPWRRSRFGASFVSTSGSGTACVRVVVPVITAPTLRAVHAGSAAG
jgi:catechol 2,3-dioxygenase-like lactoylglutathione lyase family enzyme